MRILLLDIETSPNVAHVWGLWQQNVAINQIIASGYVLCWAAKWLDNDEVIFDSVHKSGSKKMLRGIHKLLNEAQAVVTYNGNNFDLPTLRKEFVIKGMSPPPPYRSIDLYQVAKKQFRFPSNKLEYISRTLGIGGKVKHEGHELWIKVMAGDPEAWQRMEEYNKQDVVLLQALYERLKGWIPNHPNVALYDHAALACPSCGSHKVQRRGYAHTNVNEYVRYVCNDCGRWAREPSPVTGKEERMNLLRPVAAS